MRVSIVVAAAENDTIGAAGGIPWRLPDDQQRFKELTTGRCIVMGRKTHESIGRLLPNRRTIIVSGDREYMVDGAHTANGLEAALVLAADLGEQEALIVGGERLYRLGLPQSDRVYLTRVHADIEGDVHFPSIDALGAAGFELTDTEPHDADARHRLAFTFEQWDRKPETD